MRRALKRSWAIGLAVVALAGCKPEEPAEGSNSQSREALSHGYTLSQSEFDSLSPDDQFIVANKALSTMYRGLPADQFFNVPAGLQSPQVKFSNFISDTQIKLQTKLTFDERFSWDQRILGKDDDPETEADESIQARFTSFDNDQPHHIYMARMQTYPLSHDQMVTWMSYFLANTIMFSPAREMDSTNSQDIIRVLAYLDQSLSERRSIRDIIRGWLHNLSRWRVSRSPENHALEMFELYLGIFNDTAEEQQNTINGGKACSSWYLTDNDADYQLLKDLTKVEGGETHVVFGQYVATCDDLYDVVAGHPYLIPRVTEVIVNYFMDGSPAALKNKLIQDIVSSGPVTFEDIFLGVMFSEAFLLESERPKTFEENAFNFLHAMHWTPRTNRGEVGRSVIDNLLDSDRFNADIAVHRMGWAAMNYKIGRTPFLPMDVLSFATYHKGIREEVLLSERSFSGQSHPTLGEGEVEKFPIFNGAFYVAGTENLKPELENISAEDFIDLIFLTALGRRADSTEMQAFLTEGSQENRDHLREDEGGVLRMRPVQRGEDVWEWYTDDFAEVILEYISQLPEFYYYKSVN